MQAVTVESWVLKKSAHLSTEDKHQGGGVEMRGGTLVGDRGRLLEGERTTAFPAF